jgi:predicted nucleic acid-binding protein
MVILDTNVVSEMMKAPPWPGVKAWLAAQPRLTVFISAITEAELRLGVALLPVGRRRNGLAADIEAMIAEDFAREGVRRDRRRRPIARGVNRHAQYRRLRRLRR